MPLYQFNVPPDLDARILKLVRAGEVKSVQEVFGRAVTLYELAVRETGLGARLVLEYEDGRREEVRGL